MTIPWLDGPLTPSEQAVYDALPDKRSIFADSSGKPPGCCGSPMALEAHGGVEFWLCETCGHTDVAEIHSQPC